MEVGNLFTLISDPKTYKTPSPSFFHKPPILQKIKSFCFPRRKIRSLVVNCSSLKPKPDYTPEIIPEATHLSKPVPVISSSSSSSSSLSSKIERLVFLRKFKDALELFEIIQSASSCGGSDGDTLSAVTYDALVSACIGVGSAGAAKSVFRHMVDTGFEFDQYIRNRILLMYLKCGMVPDARRLFDEMPERNVVSWNTMISGLLGLRSFDEAFDLFLLMWEEIPEAIGSRSMVMGIQVSASVGKQLHSIGFKMGVSDNIFVSCALIDMYSNCDCIEEARWVFDETPEKTVVAWNTIIAGYALHGYSDEALDLYYQMQASGIKMDHFTYSMVIRICAWLGL